MDLWRLRHGAEGTQTELLQPTPVPMPRILVTPLHPGGGPCASRDRGASKTQQHEPGEQDEQERFLSLRDWSCQQAALLPPLVGLLHSYTHLCSVRLPPWHERYRHLPGQQPGKVERDDPASQSQHPYGPRPTQSLHLDAEEWESQLVRDLDSLLPSLSLCLPREGEPQHCMLARGHGGGGHNARAEQGQEQQGQGQGQEGQEEQDGARDVDAEALRAVELGATLLHLRAVARGGRAASAAAERLQLLADGDNGGPGWPSFPEDHGEPPELRFALASVGVLAAASGALLALRRALGSGRLDPARPSCLHHTTAQEVYDGLWAELRQRSAATAVSGVVEAAREAVKAAPGCLCAGGDEDAASSDSSSSRCYLGMGNWCLRHSPSYLLLLSRASHFAHDVVSLAACGGGGRGGTAGSAGLGDNSGSSGGNSSSCGATAEDGIGGFLSSARLHALLNCLASAILEVPPPPPRQPSPAVPRPEQSAGAHAVRLPAMCDALLAVPPPPPCSPSVAHRRDITSRYSEGLSALCLPDDPDHNLPPHVATCLTVSICHAASCCCMLASSEVVGKDVMHAAAMEGEGCASGSGGYSGVPSAVMRALSHGTQTLELLQKLQHQAAQDALGEERQWGHTAHIGPDGGGGSSGSDGGSSKILDALRLQRRLGVWLGSQGLSVLQTGLGEAEGQEGQSTARALLAASGNPHPGAVRAVTHLLLSAPYLMVWAFLSQYCASGTANMAFLASVRLRHVLTHCSSALHATWQLHTSHPQLRLPLPGEPQVPPPAAGSTANTRRGTAAAAAAAAASNVVGPLTLAYMAQLAVLLSAGNKWLTVLNVEDAERVGPRLARVEILAWALAGATVAAEAWARFRVQQGEEAQPQAGDGLGAGREDGQGQEQQQESQQQAVDGVGSGREEGQGMSAVPAGAPVSQMLLNQVGQLVGKVRRAVFQGPDAAVKISVRHDALVARCLAGCRLLRNFDHAIRLLASTHTDTLLTAVLRELYATPSDAISLWEVVLQRSTCPPTLGAPMGRADGGDARQAAEVQVTAAKELCGLLVSHAKLLGLHKARAQHAAPAFYSAVLECRAAREALAAGGQGREGSCSGGTAEELACGGREGSHGGAATAAPGSCEDSAGCGAGGAGGTAEDASGTAGSSGDGLGRPQGVALEQRYVSAAQKALNATADLLGEVVCLASILSFVVGMPHQGWQLGVLTGQPRRTGSSRHPVQPCSPVASSDPAPAPSASASPSSSSSSSSAAATAVDPAALAVLRGAVSHHAVALYCAVMTLFTLCQALCDVALVTALEPPPGVDSLDGLERMVKHLREACLNTRNAAVELALTTPALLLPALTRGSLARLPRVDAKYASVRMVLTVSSEMAVRVGRALTGDEEWGAAPGQGGGGARCASEGVGEPIQGASRAVPDMQLRAGCCAVLDCALRLAAREDSAGELVAWAQEAVESGRAGSLGPGTALAGPAEAKAAEARQGQNALQPTRGAVGQDEGDMVDGRTGADDVTHRSLAEAVGMLQGALASLGLQREAELAARLGAAAGAAGKAAAAAEAGGATRGAARGSGGAASRAEGQAGTESQEQQQQQHTQQRQRQCKLAVDAFRRQARELLESYSALLSYPYTAMGLHAPSSGSSSKGNSPGVQLGRGGRSKKCGKGSSKTGGGAPRQETDEAPLPVTVLPRVCSNPLCLSFEGSCEEDLWLRKCGGCLAVRYCSRGCQAAHWRAGHRGECRALGETG